MTPAPEDEAEQAAAQMAHATDRLREQARGLGRRGARAADADADIGATFSTTVYDGIPVLVVGGQVDVRTAASMRRHLLDLLDAGHVDVIVDMTAVDFMDSSGLNVLVGALRAVRPAGGSIRVVADSRHLKQLFDITGVHKILPLHPTVAAAAG
jgi:anti-sigma B factor antagonist